MNIPRSHPRYSSLLAREALVEGVREGYVTPHGLTAHGRGEAFDYLLGEATTPPAERAIRAAACALVLASQPVISVNGNVAALCPEAVAGLQAALDCRVEVNLFHRTDARIAKIVHRLEAHGCKDVLGAHPDARIPGLESERAKCSSAGIFGADAVVVPLEDGDRCEALVSMGKQVIAIDLNPLSRTARHATTTIVDDVARALPLLARDVASLRREPASEVAAELRRYDNLMNLSATLTFICERLARLASHPEGLHDLGQLSRK